MSNDLFETDSPSNQREVLTVSDLNRRARQLLETHLSLLWIEGEISNFSKPSSGHWYFTLKDEQAQVRCAMFRNRNTGVRFKPEQGVKVLLRARVSLYEGRGDYQLIVEHMEEAGFGVLQRAFEALKAKLEKEGLFAEYCKQELPELPQHIGVITSPTGAAIRDVLSVLKRRFPCIPVTILPVAVQGEGAAQQIVDAIKLANKLKQFDVLLLTRGGGSLEDLWPFNEEIVARAIFASDIPIVSAVGHEVDVTISDFVADVRAPTPSAAAELLSPNLDDWLQTFIGYEVLLRQALGKIIKHGRLIVDSLRSRLRHPGQRLQAQSQHLDHLEMRLNRAIKVQLQQARSRLHEAILQQRHFHPRQHILQHQLRLQQVSRQLQQEMRQQLKSKQQQFVKTVALLNSISPIHTLARGYSLTLDQDGHIVRNTAQVNVGQQLTTKLGKGELLCRVERVNPDYETLLAGFGRNKKN